ncbi:TetR/AcrR family transcriptional regulator [Pelagibacterium lacus]|nr:TetR/AcrR family transcriptional regulator [Pelagibacterium lacus]
MVRTVGSDGAKTEENIRRAAIALIARDGFKAVTLREIATAVGIQAGSIYRYFPSKDALLYEILREHMTQLLDAWAEAAPAGVAPERELHAFVAFHIRYHMGKRDEIFISNMELRGLADTHRGEIFALRRQYETMLADIIARGQAAGRFRPGDALVMAFAILAMLTGIFTWYSDDGKLSLSELSDLYIAMVDGGLAPD